MYDDDIFGAMEGDDDDEEEEEDDRIEERGVKLLATLIQNRLDEVKNDADNSSKVGMVADDDAINGDLEHLEQQATSLSEASLRNARLARDRFMDLTCTAKGERVLEDLFQQETATSETDEQVVQAAIMALQSVLILGTQVGVKGSPQQLQRMIAHLDSRGNQESFLLRDLDYLNEGRTLTDVFHSSFLSFPLIFLSM